MAVALIFAMKLRDSKIILTDDLEQFMKNIQPAITEENYSEILRCTERIADLDEPEYPSEKLEPSFITRVMNNLSLIINSSFHLRMTSIILIVMVGHRYITPLIVNNWQLFDIFSIEK